MNVCSQVHLALEDGFDKIDFEAGPASTSHHRLIAPLRRGIMQTRQWLLGEQHEDGYWVGELEGDTILESEYILLLAYLGREKSETARKAAAYLIRQQREEGGWSLYPGGEIDISGSVKAYFALKLVGHDPASEPMQRARAAILAAGGADRVNSFTRFYLALLGQISYDHCPEVPPEVVLFPAWLPINLYRVSAWSRTIIVPLSIMSAYRPVREIEPECGIRELFLASPDEWPPLRCPGQQVAAGIFSWDRFFRAVDRGLKFCVQHRLTPLRKRAIKQAERWMLERFDGSDGLGAIFPPIIWSLIALDCLGYSDDSSEVRFCHEQLEGLIIEEGETLRLQPCKSPVWDTAITVRALAGSGISPSHDSITRATQWLLDNEIRRLGDWSATVKAEPGGWCFEHNNEFYPDVDDTAMVLLALRAHLDDRSSQEPRSRVSREENHHAERDVHALPPELRLVAQAKAGGLGAARQRAVLLADIGKAGERGIRWMLALQNRDGGWGAFDRNNDHEFFCHVPFADHNAMIDPSTPDLTARVLEALGHWGYKNGHRAVDRAVAYLRSTQEADGSWYGRWGVNYIYGTWQVLAGLAAVGVKSGDPAIAAGANWLLVHQQASGGWGESADSYADPRKRGQGAATASQTAWALLGLMAAGHAQHPAVARGIRYLLDTQDDDGTWDEPEFTGTGFPQVFYLRYHMYPIYFPLLALSQWAVAAGDFAKQVEANRLRLVDTAALVAAGT